jgi:hypothetical protein
VDLNFLEEEKVCLGKVILYFHKFCVLTVLIAFYGFIFLPQYVLNINCEREDDLEIGRNM